MLEQPLKKLGKASYMPPDMAATMSIPHPNAHANFVRVVVATVAQPGQKRLRDAQVLLQRTADGKVEWPSVELKMPVGQQSLRRSLDEYAVRAIRLPFSGTPAAHLSEGVQAEVERKLVTCLPPQPGAWQAASGVVGALPPIAKRARTHRRRRPDGSTFPCAIAGIPPPPVRVS